jgi:hypothetical protein
MKQASIKSIAKKYGSTAGSKFTKNRNYSSFWMEDNWSAGSKFTGLGGVQGSSDTTKAIKLGAYQRAIGNFTKILTKKDLKLVFAGNESFTDGQTISLSANIGDKNFDTHVGLALHEAAHCVLTDFEATKEARNTHGAIWQELFPLINWIEDRRIDQFVFSTSPGYKAYYHKLYDTYFMPAEITKALKSRNFRDPKVWASWEMQIINMLNPAFNAKAMPGLMDVCKLIDVRNIARLKTTRDVVELALEVHAMIKNYLVKPPFQTPDQQQPENGEDQQQKKDGQGSGSDADGAGEPQDNTSEDPRDSQRKDDKGDGSGEPGGNSGDQDEQDGDGDAGDIDGGEELSPAEDVKAMQALNKQKDFMEGKINDRTKGAKALQNKLDSLAQANAEIQRVAGDGGLRGQTAIVYDLTKNGRVFSDFLQAVIDKAELTRKLYSTRTPEENAAITAASEAHRNNPLLDAIGNYFYNVDKATGYADYTDPDFSSKATITDHVNVGLQLGAFLGRKLQLRNETRDLTFNRLNSGHLDSKRIAHAGYGIENVFKQIHIDKYKATNLHISLDASGSMSGVKWRNTVMMTMAIAKAATLCSNLSVQVSLRHTGSKDCPVIVNIYDSRKNRLKQLEMALKCAAVNSVTPEGLCYEAMIKRNMFTPSNAEMDSYFLNISDGSPGGCGDYYGQRAFTHTKQQVDKLAMMGIQTISFFVESYQQKGSQPSTEFVQMYGAKNSAVVAASDMVGIAKAMNAKFLSPASLAV